MYPDRSGLVCASLGIHSRLVLHSPGSTLRPVGAVVYDMFSRTSDIQDVADLTELDSLNSTKQTHPGTYVYSGRFSYRLSFDVQAL